MTLNIETSNEAIMNKLPFSDLLCMSVYYIGNTYSDVYEFELIDVRKLESGFHIVLPANESLSRSKASS